MRTTSWVMLLILPERRAQHARSPLRIHAPPRHSNAHAPSGRLPAGESVGATKKGLRGDSRREADLFFERRTAAPQQDYGHTHGVSGVSPSGTLTRWAWRASGSGALR